MKKVLFTSILLLSAVSFGGNIYAQDTAGGNNTEVTTPSATQPSVKFTADGNTLTISGQGDLTSYMTTDWSAKVFTDKAVNNVFTSANAYVSVSANDSYNAANTYYCANYDYSLLESGVPSNAGYFTNIHKVSTWKKTADISNLYAISYVNTTNGSHMIGMAKKVTSSNTPDLTNNWSYGELANQAYYIISDEDISDKQLDIETLNENGYQTISLSDFSKKYVDVSATYSVWNSGVVFVKHANSESYESLQANKTYNYVDGDAFYTATVSFVKIDNNATFFDNAHTDYVQADNTEISFKELLRRKILEGVSVYDYNAKKEVGVSSYTTVKFVNNGSDPLLIDADVVREILYPTSNGMLTTNVTTTKLDLGEATLKELNADIFIPSNGESYKCHELALNDITFPKTKLTSVYSESANQNENKMVLPAQLLSNITGKIKTVSIPEGYDRIADGAFSNESRQSVLENVNLPKGLTLIGKNAFQDCKNIKSIELNEGLENIGKKAFMGTSLTALKFPSTLQIIHDEAFRNCYVYDLKFNAGLKFIGKGAFALSKKGKAETTLEIPASMRYIGAIAFGNRQYQDVFFYGENAPLMPFGTIENWAATAAAFDAVTLMGNNGFDATKGDIRDDAANTGYANRENYKNQGVYFCLLHYPKDLKDEQRAAYTDITRVYKTVDEGQDFYYGKNNHNPYSYHEVGQEETELKFGNYTASKRTSLGFQDTYLGRQYIWPSQEAWRRSYVVNSLGFNWNGKDKYLPTLSKEDLNVLAYAGYKVADDTHPADEATGYYKLEDLQMMAHMGTRQFPLGNEDVNVDEEPEEEPTYPINIKGGKWWTICVPFNMTKTQVDNVFGKDTHVCRFNKVERVVNSEKKVKSIKLYFTNDVYVHKSTKDKEGHYTTSTGTPVADDDIVIYAHESYMIYPTKNNDDANNMYNISDYTLVTGSPLPTLVKATEQFTGGAKESASGDASWNKEYRFVGNYQTEVAVAASEQGNSSEEAVPRDIKNVTVPQYSYIYAKKNGTPNAQFWFYTGKEMLWGANKCVVQATARDGGKSDFNTYFGGNGSARAKELSFFGTDDEVTGIENVEIIAGNENDTQIVYNLNGQVVNGNLNSLQKGIYIKNGKKFMVK